MIAMKKYVLAQVRTTTCSRNEHIAREKGGMLIYIRINIKATSVLAWIQLVEQTVVTSWNSSLSSTAGKLDCEMFYISQAVQGH